MLLVPFSHSRGGSRAGGSRNQQTSALKSLKANGAWNILVEIIAKSQGSQTARKSDVLQALIESIAKSQALQTVRKSDVLQALIESIAKKSSFANCRAK